MLKGGPQAGYDPGMMGIYHLVHLLLSHLCRTEAGKGNGPPVGNIGGGGVEGRSSSIVVRIKAQMLKLGQGIFTAESLVN